MATRPTTHIPATRTDVDGLNALLRGEISAVETYRQALSKFGQPEHRPLAGVLARIRGEHERAVAVLRERVVAHGQTPSSGAGIWGVFANAVEGAATLFGPQTALAALKQGELFGREQYEKALAADDLSAEGRMLIASDLLPACRSHAVALEQAIAELGEAK